MKKLILALSFVSVAAQASLLTFDAGTQSLENVSLSKTAHINDESGQPSGTSLDLLGAGLRTKTILFVPAKVYVAQLFSDNKAAFERNDNALTSLAQKSQHVALKLNMLRTINASTLATSFRDALDANGYTIEGELSYLLTLIEESADATQGKSITMLMIRNETGGTNIYYEDANNNVKSFVGSPELMTKVMSIWLGKPADKGLENLKQSLLKPVY